MDFKFYFPLNTVSVDSCSIKHMQFSVKKIPTTPNAFFCRAWFLVKLLFLKLKIKYQIFLLTNHTERYSYFDTQKFVNTLSKQGISFSTVLAEEPILDKFMGATISFRLIAFGESDPTTYSKRSENTSLQNIHITSREIFDNIFSEQYEISFFYYGGTSDGRLIANKIFHCFSIKLKKSAMQTKNLD